MFQTLFWKNSRFDHFGQTISKIGLFAPKCPKIEVFSFFLQSAYYYLLIFYTKPKLLESKKFPEIWKNSEMTLLGPKWTFLLEASSLDSKKWRLLAKIHKFFLNFALSGYTRPEAGVFRKNYCLNYFHFFHYPKKNYFRRKKSTLWPIFSILHLKYCLYSWSWNFCFLLFSNWPHFDQKLSQVGHFKPQMTHL